MNILLIDKDIIFLELLKDALEADGFCTDTYNEFETGIQALRNRFYDLAIVENHLGDKTEQVIKRIINDNLCNTQLILTDVNSDFGESELKLSPFGYSFKKPLNINHLVKFIKQFYNYKNN